MAYSKDFKRLVLSKLGQGWTYRQAAQEFGIAPSTILTWKQAPDSAIKPKTTRTRKISRDALLADVEEHPDAYCSERAKRFNCSAAAIHKALKRNGISLKKRARAIRKQTADEEKNI